MVAFELPFHDNADHSSLPVVKWVPSERGQASSHCVADGA